VAFKRSGDVFPSAAALRFVIAHLRRSRKLPYFSFKKNLYFRVLQQSAATAVDDSLGGVDHAEFLAVYFRSLGEGFLEIFLEAVGLAESQRMSA